MERGDVALLNDPVAQELLHSKRPAQLAYTWMDGTPRVVPIWFHWNGDELIFGSPLNAPKVRALRDGSRVAVCVEDSSSWPYRALLLRGPVSVQTVQGIGAEYREAAHRYFGHDQGEEWVAALEGPDTRMIRVAVRPDWVTVLDFETRFPSAVSG